LGSIQRCVQREGGRARQRDRGVTQQEPPLVDAVGERTADDGEQQQWSELGYAEQPDRERRAGLVEHLVRKRGNRDRAAEK